MKRPWLVTILAVVESLLGVAALTLGAYLFKLSLVSGMSKGEVIGDRVAAAIFGVAGPVWIALAVVVFLGFRWGWWLGVALNLVTSIVLGLDTVGDWRHSGLDDISLAATFVIFTILYLLPPVRHYRKSQAGAISSTEISNSVSA